MAFTEGRDGSNRQNTAGRTDAWTARGMNFEYVFVLTDRYDGLLRRNSFRRRFGRPKKSCRMPNNELDGQNAKPVCSVSTENIFGRSVFEARKTRRVGGGGLYTCIFRVYSVVYIPMYDIHILRRVVDGSIFSASPKQ